MVNDLAQKVINKKPYLATKIVTYKHNRVYDRIETYYTDTPLDPYGIETGYKCQENIDRIKLPCYCTFEWRGKRRLGLITYDELRDDSDDVGGIYSLHEIDKQTHQKVGSVIDFETDIEELIEDYKINIGKVKLTYYETI